MKRSQTPPRTRKPVPASAPDSNLSINEAAQLLRVSRSTFNRWLKEGRIHGVKVGKQWRFSRESLRAVVDIGGREADLRQESLAAGLRAIADALRRHGATPAQVNAFQQGLANRELAGVTRGIAWDFVRMLFYHATVSRASEVHLEPLREAGVVRSRAGGALTELTKLTAPAFALVTEELRYVAGMAGTDAAVPRDGRIMLGIAGQKVDVQMSCFPARLGLAVTLRFLDNDVASDYAAPLEKLVPDEAVRERVRALCRRANGLVLIAGPAASGKTVLAYALLRELAGPGTKAMTIEDPILQELDGVTQAQVDAERGFTFAFALRAIRAGAPDVVLCDRLRDAESARLVAQMGTSGRRVLAGVEASDCLAAYRALLGFDVPPVLALSALQGAIATRLVGQVCEHCRREIAPSEADARRLSDLLGRSIAGPLRTGRGCDRCRNTGFAGRRLVLEVSFLTNEIRDALARNAPTGEVQALMRQEGWRSFAEAALAPLEEGATSVQEVVRLLGELDREATRGE